MAADPSATHAHDPQWHGHAPAGGLHGGHRLVALVGAAAATLLLAIVPYHEGTVRAGYRDIGGVVTACTGHTLTAELTRTYTQAECDELLARDLVSHARPVLACLRVQVAPHTLAALVDLAFNVGAAAVCRSTTMRRINAGDLAGGCRAILQWVYVAGRDCRLPAHARFCGGIPKRRAAEAALCEQPPTGKEAYLK